jgi:hypothetical protein
VSFAQVKLQAKLAAKVKLKNIAITFCDSKKHHFCKAKNSLDLKSNFTFKQSLKKSLKIIAEDNCYENDYGYRK